MWHGKSYRKLGRNSDHRRAMLRNMATSFLREGSVKTTLSKAKELKPIVEKLITKGKSENLASKRRVLITYLIKMSLGTLLMISLFV